MFWVEATHLPTKQFKNTSGDFEREKKMIMPFTNFIIFSYKSDSVLWYLEGFVHYCGLAEGKNRNKYSL